MVIDRLFILLLFFYSFWLGAQDECTPYINTSPLFTGKKSEYYSNGAKYKEISYKEGKLDGEYIQYYGNGQIEFIRTLRNDYMQGPSKNFYQSGQQQFSGYYSFGKKSGSWTSWYESGKVKAQETYQDDHLNETCTYYYENGNIEIKSNLKGGVFIGNYSKYYENGSIHYVIPYTNGEFKGTGDFYEYWENGKVKCKANYSNGVCSGNIEFYSKDGLLNEKISNNTKGSWSCVEFHTNNNIKSISEIQPFKFIYSTYILEEFKVIGDKIYFDENEDLVKKEIYYYGQLTLNVSLKDTLSDWNLSFDKELKYQLGKDTLKFHPLSIGVQGKEHKFFNRIQDLKGKVLVKNGHGNFYDLYYYVSDWELFKSKREPYFNYSPEPRVIFNTGLFYDEWAEQLSLLIPVESFEGRNYDYTQIYAKGKIKNGLKDGLWYEGDFFSKNYKLPSYDEGRHSKEDYLIDFEEPYATYAYGKYVSGKKEGSWALVHQNYLVQGNYKNGKKEGKWIATGRKLKEKYIYSFYDMNGEPTNYVGKTLIESYYKNGLPDSLWIIYNKVTFKKQKAILYKDGVCLGSVEEYYTNGKVKIKSVLKDNKISKTYFSPLGDVVSDFDENSYEHEYYTIINGFKTGKYYAWNNDGQIIRTGGYVNNISHGEWLIFDNVGDTINMMTYKYGAMDGLYIHKEHDGRAFGMYEKGEKIGKWIDTTSNSKNISIYNKKKVYLMEYKVKNKIYVTGGNGIVIEDREDRNVYSPYDVMKKEFYYKEGSIVKKKEYYAGNKLKCEILITSSGEDSLITYHSPYGGVCVNNGDGTVTELDYENRIVKINFYESGRLQKVEYYDQGKYRHTNIFFPSRYEVSPEIYRTITKLSAGKYKVQYRIDKLNGTSQFLKLIEQVPLKYKLEKSESEKYRHKVEITNVNNFLWTTNTENEINCSYIMTIPKDETLIPNYSASLDYVKNNVKYVVKLDMNNVIVN